MGDSDSYYSCDDVSSETDNQCSGLFAAVDALDVVIGPDWAGTKRSNECDDGVDSSRIQQVGADVAVGGGKAPDELDSPTMEMWEDLRQYLVANYAKSAAKLAEMRSYDAVVSQSLGMTEMLTRLLDTGSSGDLLFVRKGSQKYIPTLNRAVPQSWGTSNGIVNPFPHLTVANHKSQNLRL